MPLGVYPRYLTSGSAVRTGRRNCRRWGIGTIREVGARCPRGATPAPTGVLDEPEHATMMDAATIMLRKATENLILATFSTTNRECNSQTGNGTGSGCRSSVLSAAL